MIGKVLSQFEITLNGSGQNGNIDFEQPNNLISVITEWSGADATDGTIEFYIGEKTSLNAVSKLGSTVTINAANSSLNVDIKNYEGFLRRLRYVYTPNANTEGTAKITIFSRD